jgi:hypothetical protein
VVFVRNRSLIDKLGKPNDSPSKLGLSEVPMMGFEPIPRFSRERILSPLRLPFRHIGAAACILSFFYDGENGIRRGNSIWQRLERVLVLGLEIL